LTSIAQIWQLSEAISVQNFDQLPIYGSDRKTFAHVRKRPAKSE
jgi:hypothetical protein